VVFFDLSLPLSLLNQKVKKYCQMADRMIDAMMREPLGMAGDLAILSHLNLLHSMSIR